jgi:DNA repair protein RecO (recombination protein O)
MIATDRGLVLRSYALGETSKIVCILGLEHGRLRLVAHGGRAARSRFGASLEPGNEVEIVYSQGPNRELGTLREASLRRAWLAGSRRLEPLAAGLAALELLDRLVPEGATEPGLGLETVAALTALRDSADRAGALHIFYAFEIRLLGRLGLRPTLAACAECDGVPGECSGVLDLEAGAFRCRQCAGSGPGRLGVSADLARLLAALARLELTQVAALESSPRLRRQAGICLHRLLTAHLERYRYPRSLLLLKKVDDGRGISADTDVISGFPTAKPTRS